MGKKFVRHHMPGTPLHLEPGSNYSKFMSEAEIHQRAIKDSENPPIKPKDFYRFKRVNPFAGRIKTDS